HPRAALPDEDVSHAHVLTGEELHAAPLPPTVTAVPGAALALLVRHQLTSVTRHRRDRLPVATATAVVLSPLLLEDENLPRPSLPDDLGPHEGALDQRRPDANGSISGGEEHFREIHGRAHFTGEPLEAQHVTGGHPILLPPGANDGVGHRRKAAPRSCRAEPSSVLEGLLGVNRSRQSRCSGSPSTA